MIQTFGNDGWLWSAMPEGAPALDEPSIALGRFETLLLALDGEPVSQTEPTLESTPSLESNPNLAALLAAMIPASPTFPVMQSDFSWTVVSGQEAGLEHSSLALNSGSEYAALTEHWQERNGWIFPNDLSAPDLLPALTSTQAEEAPSAGERVNERVSERLSDSELPSVFTVPADEAETASRHVMPADLSRISDTATDESLSGESSGLPVEASGAMADSMGQAMGERQDERMADGRNADPSVSHEEGMRVLERPTHPSGVQSAHAAPLHPIAQAAGSYRVSERGHAMAAETSPLFQQISEHLERMIVLPQERIAHVRLDPPELGAVQIAIQVNGSEVQAQFTANHEMTRRMLEQTVEQLRQMLEERGLQLGQMDVFQENASGQPFQQTQTRQSFSEAQNKRDDNSPRLDTPSWNVWGRMGAWA